MHRAITSTSTAAFIFIIEKISVPACVNTCARHGKTIFLAATEVNIKIFLYSMLPSYNHIPKKNVDPITFNV